MNFQEIVNQFLKDIGSTTWYEYVAVCMGIISVWYSRKENVLVYPTGIINTIIYIFISFKGKLLGEATVNFYYTIMSIIGWYMWTKKDSAQEKILHITKASKKEWLKQLLFFATFYISIFLHLLILKNVF